MRVICGPVPGCAPHFCLTLGCCFRFGTVASGPFFGLRPCGLYPAAHLCPAADTSGTFGSNFLTFARHSPITPAKEFTAMIELTRLNGIPMVLNSDLIKTAEASPDTMLTLDQRRKADCARDMRRGRRAGARLSRAAAGRGGAAPAITSATCSGLSPGQPRCCRLSRTPRRTQADREPDCRSIATSKLSASAYCSRELLHG